MLGKLPKKLLPEAKELLRVIPCAKTEADAVRLRRHFQGWYQKQDQRGAGDLIEKDWERMVTCYRFPEPHWRHLRTSNIVESAFATLRLRTDAAKRYRKVENATAAIWKTLLVAVKKFRKLNASRTHGSDQRRRQVQGRIVREVPSYEESRLMEFAHHVT